jgi:hypothetical protein
MRTRHAIVALTAALALALSAAPGTAAAGRHNVVQPHLRALGKTSSIKHMRHFLHSLRHRHHVSSHGLHKLVVRRRHLGGAANRTLNVRDRARADFLKHYLAKKRPRHKARVARTSRRYYAFLRSVEGYRVRQFLAEISDELDRLAYS